jgi:DNA mismatch endonuclease (patch repair protein)
VQRTPPTPPSPATRVRMQAQARRGTGPEVALRRELFALGLRYRVHRRVPGAPRRSIDIAFPRERIAVFVDGCFWHGCPEHTGAPRVNTSWWAQKRAYNAAKDADTDKRLAAAGWVVERCWEHENPAEVAARVARLVAARRQPSQAEGSIPGVDGNGG